MHIGKIRMLVSMFSKLCWTSRASRLGVHGCTSLQIANQHAR